MNQPERLDQPVLDNSPKSSPKGAWRRWVASGLAALSLSGAAGCQAQEQPDPTASVKPTTIESPAPSETSFNTPLPTGVEISPNPTETTSPTPITTEEICKKYEAELSECKPELKTFCSKVLYSCDNSAAFIYDGIEDYDQTILKNFLDRNSVINYGKTGKGLETINYKDGTPAICLVNTPDYIIEQTKDAIKQWQKDAPDFLETITENGLWVIFQNKVNPEQGASAMYNEFGVMLFNAGQVDVEDKGNNDFTKTLRIHLGVESFGAKCRALGGIYSDEANEAVIKQLLAVANCTYLYEKTHDSFYKDRMKGYQKGGDFYLEMCGDPDAIPGIIMDIKENNLIKPYGADNWQEIDAVINQ